MTRGVLIGAFLGAVFAGLGSFTIFALLGLTSIGYQVLSLASGFGAMAYALVRGSENHSDPHRR